MRRLHAISVDLEDWYQSTVDPDAELTDRFVRSTERMLEAFGQHGIRATFFVLGRAAEILPKLIQTLAQAGHEVQSHGYGHREVFSLTKEQFRQDLTRTKKMLEDMISQEVYGYRAPSFSIDDRTPWAWDVLAETGHRYDSSVFPMRMRRYGMAGYPPEPRIVITPSGCRIVEAPITVFHYMGRCLPIGGGGYFRLWPYWVIRSAWHQLEREGRPGIVYMHPYEYDSDEFKVFQGKVGWKTRLHQGLGRKNFPRKTDRLLQEFRFGPLSEVLTPMLTQLSSMT